MLIEHAKFASLYLEQEFGPAAIRACVAYGQLCLSNATTVLANCSHAHHVGQLVTDQLCVRGKHMHMRLHAPSA